MSFFQYIVNICIFLPILLGLFLLVTKLSANQYAKNSNKKYVSVLEKTLIAKDTYSLVIRTGDAGLVGISSPSGFQTLKELSNNEIEAFTKSSRDDIEAYTINTKAILSKIKIPKIIKKGEN